ncbi:hypothetical protein KR059_011741 [Drosophila kikkawai]|nr:hypothetical protein KR059_011741 [Drosophila kikkawai]
MLTKVALPCGMQPVPVAGNPGYVHLRVDGDNVPLHLTDRLGDLYYINRRKVQSWFRENINAVIPQLNHIRCSGGRSFELSNRSGGHVAHTIKARCLSQPGRNISFDFVPAFEFMASEWPGAFPKYSHKDLSWYAVPRKIRSSIGEDPLSFIVCAPHWERMGLEKKQNLKDALRLMKALREGNDMHMLFSYAIKSVFLNATSQKRINWNQSPGRILIRAVDSMAMFLRKGFLPFYLAPDANLFEDLPEDQARSYIRILRRIFRRLTKCRDRNCMTTEDIQIIFGNGVLMS